MDSVLSQLQAHVWMWFALVAFIVLVVAWKFVMRLFGIVIIPDDSIGLVTKKFVLLGSHRELPAGKIIALKGEAGLQADTLAPGLKFGYWPWQYAVDITPFLVVPNGSIAAWGLDHDAAVKAMRSDEDVDGGVSGEVNTDAR